MNRLKELREAKGWTQKQLAEASGVNLRMVQYYEQGVKDLGKAKITTVVRLATALGCDLGDLVKV